MKVTTSGFRDLDRQLARMARGVPAERQMAALEAGAEVVAAEMRRLAPVDTGTLRDSITVTDGREGQIYGKVNLSDISVFVGPIGSTDDGDVYYAKFQEFGWLDNPGSPFMRPAIATKRPEAERLVLTRLAAEVTDVKR